MPPKNQKPTKNLLPDRVFGVPKSWGSIHPWKPRSAVLSPKKTAPSNNEVKTNIYSKTRVITVITCHHRKEIACGCLYVKQHLCIYSIPDGDLHIRASRGECKWNMSGPVQVRSRTQAFRQGEIESKSIAHQQELGVEGYQRSHEIATS